MISLDLGERAQVRSVDVAEVCDDSPRAFDVVTARSFGDVETTTAFIDHLLDEGGVALISEPPTDRTAVWSEVLHHYPSLIDTGVYQGIRKLTRRL